MDELHDEAVLWMTGSQLEADKKVSSYQLAPAMIRVFTFQTNKLHH
jgi:hypothetical protein